MSRRSFILGGGLTGLAAGLASGYPIFERLDVPGGICSSYYVRPNSTERLYREPAERDAYRFEIGGGHWIWGGDPVILNFIHALTPLESYTRRAGVYFRATDTFVPYPIQNNLSHLPADVRARALSEMARPAILPENAKTFDAWLESAFGKTLCELFFHPFHEKYTAGAYREIAPIDTHKSPVDLDAAIRGAFGARTSVGYNTTFVYPKEGLDALARRMAEGTEIHYGAHIAAIDTAGRRIHFADGSRLRYDTLLSTLPLDRMLEIAGIGILGEPEPATSVLTLNIGAVKGPRAPDAHWLYVPDSRSGFHRVGFYSNVDARFVPRVAPSAAERVSLYVETSYRRGEGPSDPPADVRHKEVIAELKDWGFIGEVEVVDPTWIDVAYTWERPGSRWRTHAITALERVGIIQIGRFGRWSGVGQGICHALQEGFAAGVALRSANAGRA